MKISLTFAGNGSKHEIRGMRGMPNMTMEMVEEIVMFQMRLDRDTDALQNHER